MKSLQGLRNLPSNAPELLAERDDILTAIELEHQREKGAGWKDCFVDGGIRGNKRVLIAFTTLMFQNFSGTNGAPMKYSCIWLILADLDENVL